MIKKLNVMAMMVVVLCLTACSSDDDASNDNSSLSADQFAGTWFVSDYVVANGQEQISTGDQVITTFFREQGKDFNMRMVFNQSTNRVESSGAFNVDRTELSDTGEVTGTLDFEVNSLFNTAGWEINNDFILLTRSNGSTVTLRVNSIEGNRLVFTADLGQILNLPAGISVSGAARFTLGK